VGDVRLHSRSMISHSARTRHVHSMVWTSRHWLQRQRILAQHDPSLPNLMHVLRPSLQETHIIHAHATSLRSTSFPPRLHQPLDRGVCVVRSQVSFLSY